MIANWLDVVLILILAVFFVLGVIKGFVRQLFGLAAIVAGLIAALLYYPQVSLLFEPLVAKKVFSQFLAFASIVLFFLCLGWLFSRVFGRMVKGPLRIFNHIMGGAVGIIKGVLLCGILCFSLLVFPVTTRLLKESSLAPVCLKMTRYAADLIPRELKEKFNKTYNDVVKKREKDGKGI